MIKVKKFLQNKLQVLKVIIKVDIHNSKMIMILINKAQLVWYQVQVIRKKMVKNKKMVRMKMKMIILLLKIIGNKYSCKKK